LPGYGTSGDPEQGLKNGQYGENAGDYGNLLFMSFPPVWPGVRGQKTEDRGQRTEDRRQRTEDRGQPDLAGKAADAEITGTAFACG